MNFEHMKAMEKNKNKQEGLKEQVHSEFETSIGNDYAVVREETPKKTNKADAGEALNWPEPDDGSVKIENSANEQTPKMDAGEKS